jgi:catechol 2,3-dioxygenase-like lactoylglutathione lyase family enzyme
MTDSTNMRFRFAEGFVILNWEIDPDNLRWCDPATGKEIGFSGKGRIPIKEWVTIDWIVEAGYSALLVNGTERIRVEAEYGHLAGQIGIGAAAGSIVTVQSLRVTGEETQEGQAIKPRPVFDWDGGFIYARFDEHEHAVRWYKETLGLPLQWPTMEDRHDPDSEAEKMSSLAFPAGGLIHLKSAKSNEPLRHFPAEGNQANMNVGYMFNSPDLHAAREYFVQLGIEAGEIAIGFDGRQCFVIRCIDGSQAIIRFDDGHEGFPISGYGPWYVRVPDLDRAVSWYSEHLALQLVKIVVPDQCIEIQGNCYLVFDPSAEYVIRPVGSACPYFFTKNIEEQHVRLSARGVSVSDIVGTGWRAMHVYDPFGNRLNVWSY